MPQFAGVCLYLSVQTRDMYRAGLLCLCLKSERGSEGEIGTYSKREVSSVMTSEQRSIVDSIAGRSQRWSLFLGMSISHCRVGESR